MTITPVRQQTNDSRWAGVEEIPYKAAGAAPLTVGEPGYRPGLDRDGDGVACE